MGCDFQSFLLLTNWWCVWSTWCVHCHGGGKKPVNIHLHEDWTEKFTGRVYFTTFPAWGSGLEMNNKSWISLQFPQTNNQHSWPSAYYVGWIHRRTLDTLQHHHGTYNDTFCIRGEKLINCWLGPPYWTQIYTHTHTHTHTHTFTVSCQWLWSILSLLQLQLQPAAATESRKGLVGAGEDSCHPAHLHQIPGWFFFGFCLVFSQGSTSTSLNASPSHPQWSWRPFKYIDFFFKKRPHWCWSWSCQPQHITGFTCMVQKNKLRTKTGEIFQQPHLWSQRSHCCHLLSTLWEICWSSPAPPRSTWASLGTRDCPDSSRWTPEEDAPSSDRRARKDNGEKNKIK